MSTSALSTRISRVNKKVERPRPLKSSSGGSIRGSLIEGGAVLENLLSELEFVCRQLNTGQYDRSVIAAISSLSNGLRIYGAQLENLYSDQLDKSFVTLRNACRDSELDVTARVHLLEVIELRAKKWQLNENIACYYKNKLSEVECDVEIEVSSPAHISAIPHQSAFQPIVSQTVTVLNHGEVVKESGKYPKPTKIPGKNYFKDEVVIRNADSGKVMGIKGRRVHTIEELSETVISFQRVNPGAKERLVQITGPNHDAIGAAKHLIEDTILRNASPIRNDPLSGSNTSLNSSASDESRLLSQQMQQQRPPVLQHSMSLNDSYVGEYKHTVTVGDHTIKIIGGSFELVQLAKITLDEFFNHYQGGDTDLRKPFAMKSTINQLTPKEEKREEGMGDTKAYITQQSRERVTYPRDFLIKCSISPLCQVTPKDWGRVVQELPDIIRKPSDAFDGTLYLHSEWKGEDAVINLTDTETE